jgi:tryptophan-rich sensory protein
MMRYVLFFILNFGALGLGGWLMGSTPVENNWYQALHKAPWTPPGWVFGVAWTFIMICYSLFMGKATQVESQANMLYVLFAIQLLLNVIWNPVFFRWHMSGLSLAIIFSLTLLIAWFTYWGFKNVGLWGILMLPYILWLCIACSLNWYAFAKN